MLEAIAECRGFVAGMTREQFDADPRTHKAVVWNLTILGEAARHIPDDVLDQHPEIPWPQMRGIRNHIVHGYDRIDLEIIWNVVQGELPPLVPLLEAIESTAVE